MLSFRNNVFVEANRFFGMHSHPIYVRFVYFFVFTKVTNVYLCTVAVKRRHASSYRCT